MYADPSGLREATAFEMAKVTFLYNYILNDKTLQDEFGASLAKIANDTIRDIKVVIKNLSEGETSSPLQAVWTAIGRLWSPDERKRWKSSYARSERGFGANTNKCNLFVWTCYDEDYPVRRSWTFFEGYYGANATADPLQRFPNWSAYLWQKNKAEVGDIVAFPAFGESGHMVIHLGGGLLIGHSGKLGVSVRSYDYISSQKGTHGLIRRLRN